MTPREYRLRMEAQQLKETDEDRKMHKLAFLSFIVKAKKKVSKDKMEYVYKKFEDFYDYDKELRKAKPKKKNSSRFSGLMEYMRGNNDG